MSAKTNGFLDFTVETAQDMMSELTHPLDAEWPVEHGVSALLASGKLSLPVIAQGKIVGTLRRVDILQLERLTGIAYIGDKDRRWFLARGQDNETQGGIWTPKQSANLTKLNGHTLVRDVMAPHLAVRPDQSVGEIADLLIDHINEALYVVVDGEVIGEVSTLDMLNHLRPSHTR